MAAELRLPHTELPNQAQEVVSRTVAAIPSMLHCTELPVPPSERWSLCPSSLEFVWILESACTKKM